MSDKKEINTAFIEQVVTFIKDNNSKELNDIIADLHVADIAEILKELSVSHAQFLYQIIDEEKSAEILVELNDDLREKGFALLCVAYPKSDLNIVIGKEVEDDLYNDQFGKYQK